MSDQPLSDRAKRRARRRVEADTYAKDARFWRKPGSAERAGHTRPVNRAAARELRPKKK